MPFELVYICASDRSYGLDWIWVSIYVIIVDWIGLGHRVGGLDWIGFRKLNPCPTLGYLDNVTLGGPVETDSGFSLRGDHESRRRERFVTERLQL